MLEKWIPSEKIIRPLSEELVEDNDIEGELNDFWHMVDQIDDLSIHAGLDRVSGQRDVYVKSLKLTIKEIEKSDALLRNYLASGDMRNFSIEVHSMKASLANIGALELSIYARELEKASDKPDIDYCSEHLLPFLAALNIFSLKLKKAFNEIEPDDGPLVIPDELPDIFNTLTDALNRMDFIAIDNAVERMKALKLRGAIKTEIEDIKDSILLMDYTSATDKMRALVPADM
jgi:HPt (histidine-containing phosphotransfer) domain-containing protein